MLVLVTSRAEVQRELKLSDTDVASLTRLSKNFRSEKGEAQNSRHLETELKKIIDPEASQRLAQIAWQVRPDEAFRDEKVARQLNLTKQQKESIQQLWLLGQKDLMAALRRIRFKAAADREAFIWKHLDAVAAEMRDLLSDAQNRKFRAIVGEPVDFIDRLRIAPES